MPPMCTSVVFGCVLQDLRGVRAFPQQGPQGARGFPRDDGAGQLHVDSEGGAGAAAVGSRASLPAHPHVPPGYTHLHWPGNGAEQGHPHLATPAHPHLRAERTDHRWEQGRTSITLYRQSVVCTYRQSVCTYVTGFVKTSHNVGRKNELSPKSWTKPPFLDHSCNLCIALPLSWTLWRAYSCYTMLHHAAGTIFTQTSIQKSSLYSTYSQLLHPDMPLNSLGTGGPPVYTYGNSNCMHVSNVHCT